MPERPTWREISDSALDSIHQARVACADARDWLRTDWADGYGPVNGKQRHEAARLIAEAKAKLEEAKTALYRSAGEQQ